MSMQIVIETGGASSALDQIERSLEQLDAMLSKVGNNRGIAGMLNELSSFRGISGIDSLRQLDQSINSLASSARRIRDIATAMEQLSKIDVTAAAQGVTTLAAQLANIRVPAGLAEVARGFATITNNAQIATRSVNVFNSAVQQTSGHLQNQLAVTQMVNNARATMINQSQQATTAMNGFASSISGATGLLSAFGVSIGAAGLLQFVRHSYEATTALQKFQTQMATLGGVKDSTMDMAKGTEFAKQQLNFLRATARETGYDLQTLLKTYGLFTNAVVMSGVKAPEAAENYRKLAVAFRVLGLSTAEAERSFKAFEQMYAKGGPFAQELQQQLANNGIPAFELLAHAIGKSTNELADFLKQSRSIKNIQQLIDYMYKITSAGLPQAMQSWAAAMAGLKLAVDEASIAFGELFAKAAGPGIKQLTESLMSPNVIKAMETLGKVMGELASGFMKGAAWAAQFGAIIIDIAAVVVEAVKSFITWVTGFDLMTSSGFNFIEMLGSALFFVTAFVAAALTIRTITATFYALSAAAAVLTAALTPMGLVITGITAALVVGAVAAYAWANGVSFSQAASSLLASSMQAVTQTAQQAAASIQQTAQTYEEQREKTKASTEEQRRAIQAVRDRANWSKHGVEQMNRESDASDKVSAAAQKYYEAQSKAASGSKEAAGQLTGLKNQLDNAEKGLEKVSRGGRAWEIKFDIDQKANQEIERIRQHLGSLTSIDWVIRVRTVYEAGGRSSGNVEYADENGNVTSAGEATGERTRPVGDANGDIPTQDPGALTKGVENWRSPSEIFDQSAIFHDGGYTSRAIGALPMSPMFRHAPSYATGSTNVGGGIPIIAHDNEAVVPLPDGSSIPVMFTGGMRDAGGPVVAQAVRRLTDRVNFHGDHIWRELITANNNLVALTSAVNQMKSSGGGSYSGGSSGGGSSGPIGTPMSPSGGVKGVGGMGISMPGAKGAQKIGAHDGFWRLPDGSLRYFPVTAEYGKDIPEGSSPVQIYQNYLKGAAGKTGGYSDSLRTRYHLPASTWAGAPQYAMGTPNTSGGIPAILHDNEAVVPLPDGRSIPVVMRGEGGGGGDITIHMTVVTKDADSFRKSKDQVIQELQEELARTQRRVGRSVDRDDPTGAGRV